MNVLIRGRSCNCHQVLHQLERSQQMDSVNNMKRRGQSSPDHVVMIAVVQTEHGIPAVTT